MWGWVSSLGWCWSLHLPTRAPFCVLATLYLISPINIRNYDSKNPTLSTASQYLSSFRDRPTIEARERSPPHSTLFNTCSGVWHLSLAFLSPLNMTCKPIGETPLLQGAGRALTHPGTHLLFMEQTFPFPPKPALLLLNLWNGCWGPHSSVLAPGCAEAR